MLINVKVKTNKKENKISLQDNVYLVELKAKAEKGKANMELIKVLSEYLKSNVQIVSGFKNRNKIVKVG